MKGDGGKRRRRKTKRCISYHAILSGDSKKRYIPSVRELKGAVKSGRAKKEKIEGGRWAITYEEAVYIVDSDIELVITVLTLIEHNTNQFVRAQRGEVMNMPLLWKNFGIK